MSIHDCETVEISVAKTDENPDGKVVINKSDFVEGEHTLFADPTPVVNKEPPVTIAKPWAKP